MLFLIFLALYLFPVLPVARRVHYVRTTIRPWGMLPERHINLDRYHGTAVHVVGGEFLMPKEVCNNCGGGKSNHKGGSYYSTLGKANSNYMTYRSCDNFEPWDGKRDRWDETPVYRAGEGTVLTSILLSLGLWWVFVIKEVSKRAYLAVDPDWSKFAVEYHGVESKDAKIARLQRELTQSEAKTNRILSGVDQVQTIEELDRLVS